MLEQELLWERDLFFFLNGSDSVFWDHFFWMYSYKWTWIPFYLCFLFVFIYRKHWKEIVWTLLAVALLVLLCDRISSGMFKPLFHRFRPTHHPDFQDAVDLVFGYRGGLYGFISSHAANAFGFATFTALLFRNRIFSATVFLFAVLNAYSRVYLGVHFVSDVTVGAIAGAILGFAVYTLYNWGRRRWLTVREDDLKKSSFPSWEIYLPCLAYAASIVVLLCISAFYEIK